MIITHIDDIVGNFFIGMGRSERGHNRCFKPRREDDLNLRFCFAVLLANIANIWLRAFACQKSSGSFHVEAALAVITYVPASSPENSIPHLLAMCDRCECEELF